MVRKMGTFDLGAYARAIYMFEENLIRKGIEHMRKVSSSHGSAAVHCVMGKIQSMNTRSHRKALLAVRGHAILDDWFTTIKRMDRMWPRSLTQVEGTKQCVGALCWHFFGDAMSTEIHTIKKRLGVRELSRWYFAEWARREGKTMQMCIIVSTTMYVASHMWFLVYSNGGRASKNFHSRVLCMLFYLCDGKRERFAEVNKETIQFRSLRELGITPATLKSYPSSPYVRASPPPPFSHFTHHSLSIFLGISLYFLGGGVWKKREWRRGFFAGIRRRVCFHWPIDLRVC